MTLRPCIHCGELSDRPRCTEHRAKKAPKKGTTQRGYGHVWQQLSKRARRLQPFWSDCGSTDDLTVDHSRQAWERYEAGLPIRLDDVAVVCRPCNAARGQQRPTGGKAEGVAADPLGKAEGRLLTGNISGATGEISQSDLATVKRSLDAGVPNGTPDENDPDDIADAEVVDDPAPADADDREEAKL